MNLAANPDQPDPPDRAGSHVGIMVRCPSQIGPKSRFRTDTMRERKGIHMAAMKPRTGDGPLEVTKEGRGYVMRVPLEGGGRLVVELNGEEAKDLGEKLLALFA